MEERVLQMKRVHTEAIELFAKKNSDYGDAFATYGTVGVIVRMGDKISRLASITNKGVNLVEDEKLRGYPPRFAQLLGDGHHAAG